MREVGLRPYSPAIANGQNRKQTDQWLIFNEKISLNLEKLDFDAKVYITEKLKFLNVAVIINVIRDLNVQFSVFTSLKVHAKNEKQNS